MWTARIIVIVTLFCGLWGVPAPSPYELYPDPDYSDEITGQFNDTSSEAVTRVMGGKDENPGDFPHQVYLSHKKDGTEYMCGASIIDPLLLLTAAHCVQNLKPAAIKVVTGEHDLSKNDTTEQYHQVRSIIIHQDFNDKTLVNDIAILVLKNAVKFDDFTKPIKIPNGDQELPLWASVSGWGWLGNKTTPNVLQKARVAIQKIQKCRSEYMGSTRQSLTDDNICAGGTGDKDVCAGDSGGPLTCVDNKGEKFLCGITSWGFSCEKQIEEQIRKPGVYTNVKKYHAWLCTNMQVWSRQGAGCAQEGFNGRKPKYHYSAGPFPLKGGELAYWKRFVRGRWAGPWRTY